MDSDGRVEHRVNRKGAPRKQRLSRVGAVFPLFGVEKERAYGFYAAYGRSVSACLGAGSCENS